MQMMNAWRSFHFFGCLVLLVAVPPSPPAAASARLASAACPHKVIIVLSAIAYLAGSLSATILTTCFCRMISASLSLRFVNWVADYTEVHELDINNGRPISSQPDGKRIDPTSVFFALPCCNDIATLSALTSRCK